MKSLKFFISVVVVLGALVGLQTAVARPQAIPVTIQSVQPAVAPAADTLPPPHLGYGLNVRANFDLAAGLGFEWIKLYEDIFASPSDFPVAAAQYHILYRIKAEGQPVSVETYLAHVQQLALAGRGTVKAYEIGNEPNLRNFWGGQSPNPEQYGRLLCNTYNTIKAIDPQALVISAGLAPVGRTAEVNYVYAMDDRVYAQRMLDAIQLADPAHFPCFDAFGYHPQGFPYPPEISYAELQQQHPDDNGNDFRFGATEWFHALMVNYAIGHLSIWPTEFGWMRDATYDAWDGAPPYENYNSFCWTADSNFRLWSWMRVSEAQQADYLVRAFQYADRYMPWLGVMFVFNVDWNNQGWECDHVKFFSIYKAATGRTDSDPLSKIPSQAVAALTTMPKRSLYAPPQLSITPTRLAVLTEVATPTITTRTLAIENLNAGNPLTWTLTFSTPLSFELSATPLSGTNAASVMVQVNTSPITATGVYTADLVFSAEPSTTLGSPLTLPVTVIAVDHLTRAHLPLIARDYTPPQPPTTTTLQLGLAFVSAAESPANETRYSRATSLGSPLNRWPMYWPNIETQPLTQPRVFNWSKQDANIIADFNHGLTPLPILMLTPIGLDTAGSRLVPAPRIGAGLQQLLSGQADRPTQPSSQGSPPQGLSLPVFTDNSDIPGDGKTINPNNRWAYFVNAAVNRYKPGGILAQAQGWSNDRGIRQWEIWNEEDLNQFFIGTPADFARLMKVAYLAGKHADPQATIVFGGLAHFEKPTWLLDTLNVIATDPMSTTYHGFMDAVASHNYSWAWQTFGYLFEDRVRLNARGFTNVKLWITETGVPVCDDSPIAPFNFCPSTYRGTMSEQVDFLLQTAAWSAWMNAENMVWFQLYDDVGNTCPYDFFGLVRNPASGPCVPNTGTPRPAYNTFKLAQQLFGDVQPYWRSRPTTNQEIIAFKRPATSERVVAMWTRYYLSATVTLTATASSAQLRHADGTAQTIFPVNGLYVIDLPAATNLGAATPDRKQADGTSSIGGSPRILIEYDPNAK